MLDYIDKTNDIQQKKDDIQKDKYLFVYEIREFSKIKSHADEKVIGYSRICNPENNEKQYKLEIEIQNTQDFKTYYHEILQQSLYKFINLVGSKPEWRDIILVARLDNSNKTITDALEKEYFIKTKHDVGANQNYQFRLANIKGLYPASIKKTKKQSLQTKKQTLKIKSSSITNKTIKGKYDKTFIISSAKIRGLLYTPLQHYLMQHGYKEISDPNGKPFLLFLQEMENNKLNTAYYNTSCYIMNQFDDSKEIITNKANLYANFKRGFPEKCSEFMADSWSLHEFIKNRDLKKRITNDHEVFIIRPAGRGAFSGKDIYVVNNKVQLENAIQNTRKYRTVLISKYITNPLLLDGKKFHLRVYYGVSLINGQLRGKMFDFYEPLSASKPYKKSDWGNPDIHDTHARGTEKELIWPEDISSSTLKKDLQQKYIPKMKECLQLITKMIKGKISTYPQAQNAFEVFGCDFLILDDGNIILMEINDKVGFGFKATKNTIRLSKLYCNAIINDILAKIL